MRFSARYGQWLLLHTFNLDRKRILIKDLNEPKGTRDWNESLVTVRNTKGESISRFRLAESFAECLSENPRERKGFMAALATTEVCDTYPSLVASGELRVLQPIFQIYGRRRAFFGPIVTVKVFEDSVLLRECLEERGNGRILIVDGGGSTRCCILGGNVVVSAQNNGWAGIIVNGCIRDVDEINRCDIGVRALAAHPLKANKKGVGEKNVPIYVAGTRILPAEWCYADTDGVLVSQQELSL